MPRQRQIAQVEYEYLPDYATSEYVPPGEPRPSPGDYAASLALLVATVLGERPYKIALPFPKRMLRDMDDGTATLDAVATALAAEFEEALPDFYRHSDHASRWLVVTIDREKIRATLEAALPARMEGGGANDQEGGRIRLWSAPSGAWRHVGGEDIETGDSHAKD